MNCVYLNIYNISVHSNQMASKLSNDDINEIAKRVSKILHKQNKVEDRFILLRMETLGSYYYMQRQSMNIEKALKDIEIKYGKYTILVNKVDNNDITISDRIKNELEKKRKVLHMKMNNIQLTKCTENDLLDFINNIL